MFDLKITGGTIVDGTGAKPFVGDVAIADGRIVAVGASVAGDAKQTIDATGKLVTPGFVDIHTHYDGQVTWDETLEPSSGHGVTTVVMGNCGVGFAPVKPGKEEWLIQLMEGVEDIPGTALSEGIDWKWETFPEYLEALSQRKTAVDFGTQIAHGAVRAYVMGERGARNEPATPEDIRQMRTLVKEAIDAGALGVSTSRVLGHRAMDGEPVPGTFAAEDELFGLGHALKDCGRGVFELAPAGADGQDLVNARKEVDWMRKLSAEIGRPVTFALVQNDAEPELWKEIMAESVAAADEGAQLYPQIAARPFGLMIGLQTHHGFAKRPTFVALKERTGSLEELVVELRKPENKAAILAEEDLPPNDSDIFDGLTALVRMVLDKLYVLGDPPDYEPTADKTVAAIAESRDQDALECLYDLSLEDEGRAMMMLPMFNYSRRQPRRHSRADDAPLFGVGAVRRRRPLRHDLRRVDSDLHAHSLDPRSLARRQARPRVDRQEAVEGHRRALRSDRPRNSRSRQEGRSQRHRLRQADVAVGPHGARPAGRRPAPAAGGGGLRLHDRLGPDHAQGRRRHRRPPGAIGARGSLDPEHRCAAACRDDDISIHVLEEGAAFGPLSPVLERPGTSCQRRGHSVSTSPSGAASEPPPSIRLLW